MDPAHARRVARAFGLGLLGLLVLTGCGGASGTAGVSAAPATAPSSGSAAKVTFVELGSKGCIPCDEMRPIMDTIAHEFGDQVKVIFYDVRKDPAPADLYGIQFIPTQVFLDEKGVEFHRHTGFYPQEKIEALLRERGLNKVATP